ncbi:MAG: ABC transporter ATP-binding protein [Desulfobacterota bacterium]|jgi:branched-chain amino acid transport system ATP-binding protein|nr:ABC transporter ATP-binding protein [Thermodesulfobacteriota bacterium]
MAELLKIDQIHTYYGNIHALKGVSLTVHEGEIVTLIGSNGAGKTTTINTISGILKPKQGAIFFKGEKISNLRPHEIVTRGVCQSREGRKLFTRLTVLENLDMGAFTRNDKHGIREDVERAYKLFPILKERRHQVSGTLSGGEQQMLAIARALMSRPQLLLLDEPSMGLAPIVVEKIFDIILDISMEKVTILLVEQNALMAFLIADRGYVIQSGKIALEDTVENLQENENIRKLYLGEEV